MLVGIVDADDALSNRQAYASLERLRYLTDIPDGAIEVAVRVGDPARAPEVAAVLRESPALKPYLVQAWSERPLFATISDMTGLVYGVLRATMGLRLSAEEEYDGADLSIHRIGATPDREVSW